MTALGKQKSWEEFGQFMEKSSTENTTQFYKALKNEEQKRAPNENQKSQRLKNSK